MSTAKVSPNKRKTGARRSGQGKPVSDAAIRKLKRIHREIMTLGRTSLKKAMQAGEILAGVKDSLVDHGEWLSWLEKNVRGIKPRTAQNYMKLWRKRVIVENALNAHLAETYSEALALVSRPPQEPEKKTPVADSRAGEQTQKREVIAKLADVIIDGLESEETAVLELFLERLPELRTKWIAELRSELGIGAAGQTAPSPISS